MRHQVKTVKLKRTAEHRDAMLANMAMSLIEHERIKTTLAKAKALRPVVEKLVTLGKKNTLHTRRLAAAKLRQNTHWETLKAGKSIDHVAKLFNEIAPAAKNRNGGYTRILKLATRMSDAAPMALIEWVDRPGDTVAVEVAEPAAEETKTTKKASAKVEKSENAATPVAEDAAKAEASDSEATEAKAADKDDNVLPNAS